MTAPIERRLEALERHGAGDWRTAREMSDAELIRIIVEPLGYMPGAAELARIINELGPGHDATAGDGIADEELTRVVQQGVANGPARSQN